MAGGGMIYFLSMYTKWACPTPAAFRATNILISAFSNVWRAVLLLVGGLMTLAILVEAALLMTAVFLGGWGGGRVGRLGMEERRVGEQGGRTWRAWWGAVH